MNGYKMIWSLNVQATCKENSQIDFTFDMITYVHNSGTNYST